MYHVWSRKAYFGFDMRAKKSCAWHLSYVSPSQGCKMPDTVPVEKMRAWLGKPCMPAEPKYDAWLEQCFQTSRHMEWKKVCASMYIACLGALLTLICPFPWYVGMIPSDGWAAVQEHTVKPRNLCRPVWVLSHLRLCNGRNHLEGFFGTLCKAPLQIKDISLACLFGSDLPHWLEKAPHFYHEACRK